MDLVNRAIRSICIWINLTTLLGCTLNREKHPDSISFSKIDIAFQSYYQCPNHPEIKQYNPGYCSICHSDLEKPGSLAMDKNNFILTQKSEKSIVVHVKEKIIKNPEYVSDSLHNPHALLTLKDRKMYISLAGHQYAIEEYMPVFNRGNSKKWIPIENLEFNDTQKITSVTIKKNGIWVPKDYLILENGQYYVLKLAHGKLIKLQVITGFSSDNYVELLDLEDGTKLCLPN